MTSDVYTHGHHESVLRSHSWRTAANSAAHLLPHLREGQRLLDVGCGPGTITVDLATHVAPGPVIGVDTSAEVLERARRYAAELGAPVSFQVGDVYALDFPDASFDVVHAHQVLQHLTDPVAALREIRRVTRPGGVVALREGDYGAMTWYPPSAALEDWRHLYHEVTVANRAEADAGRRWVPRHRAVVALPQRHHSPGPGHPPDLPQRRHRIGQVLEHLMGVHDVEARVREVQRVHVAHLEGDRGAQLGGIAPSALQHLGRGVDTDHRPGRNVRREVDRDGARATSDVQQPVSYTHLRAHETRH